MLRLVRMHVCILSLLVVAIANPSPSMHLQQVVPFLFSLFRLFYCVNLFFYCKKGNAYGGQCYGRIDDTWSPTIQNNVFSGRIVRPNIYVADIGHYNIKEMLGLHMPEGKGRAIR
jgi:hypothetical protein